MRKKFRKGTSFVLSTLLSVMMVFGNFTMPVMAEGDNLDKTPAEEITSEATLNETSPSTSEITSENTSETTSELKTEVSSEVTPKLLAGGLLGASGTMSGNGTAEDPFIIEDADDWNMFAANVEAGTNADAYYKLGASITITDSVGSEEQPFKGHFDGNRNESCILTVAINNTAGLQGIAPFRYISGAEITNVNATGSVVSKNGRHTAGLVGFNLSGTSKISDCHISVNVSGYDYGGGIVAHGKSATLTLEDCIYDGNISAKETIGGLVGWNDNSRLTLNNCFFNGTYSNASVFHPVVAKADGETVQLTATDCYYTKQPSTESSSKYVGSNVGSYVTTIIPEGVIYKKIEINSVEYYTVCTVSGIKPAYFNAGSDEVSYTVTCGGKNLTPATDYTVSLTRDGQATTDYNQIGDYQLTITGKGDYKGSETFAFKVMDKQQYVYAEVGNNGTVTRTLKDIPKDAVLVDSSTTTWRTDYYVVAGDITISERVYVDGHARLILLDGATLTVKGGINVSKHQKGNITHELSIYGQEKGTGKLIADARTVKFAAGIGGYLYASVSENDWAQCYGRINIHGGTIEARGGAGGAGIGCGRFDYAGIDKRYIGIITITGGTVTAYGSEDDTWGGSAAIGGGYGNVVAGTLNLFGGNIKAYASKGGYGIGPGRGLQKHDAAMDCYIAWDNDNLSIYSDTFVSNEQGCKYIVLKNITDGENTIEAGTYTNFPYNGKTLTPAGYSVKAADGITNGTVTISKTVASAGETIAVTLTPDAGYIPENVTYTYTDADNVSHTVNATADSNNACVYRFTMPNADVEVNATFKAGAIKLGVSWASASEAVVQWQRGPEWITKYTAQVYIAGTGGNVGDEIDVEAAGDTLTYNLSDVLAANPDAKGVNVRIYGYNSQGEKVAEGKPEYGKVFVPFRVTLKTVNEDGETIDANGGKAILDIGDSDKKDISIGNTNTYYLQSGGPVTLNPLANKGYVVHTVKVGDINQQSASSYDIVIGENGEEVVITYKKSDSEKIQVTVYFGSNDHMGAADSFAGNIRGMEVDSSAVSFTDVAGARYKTVKNQRLEELISEIQSCMPSEFSISEYRVGISESYDDFSSYNSEMNGVSNKYLSELASNDEVKLYITWFEEIGTNDKPIIMNIDIPICGTEVSTDLGRPVLTLDTRTEYENAVWTVGDTLYAGKVTGDDELTAVFDLYPKWGYYIPYKSKVNVNGDRISDDDIEEMYYGETSAVRGIRVKKTITAEHNWKDGVCSGCSLHMRPELKECAVLLDGQIGVKFRLSIPTYKGYNYDESYVEFRVSGKGGKTTKVPYSEGETVEGGKIFTCRINSIQMAETITGVLVYSDAGIEKTVVFDYSVERYIKSVMANQKDYDENTINLVKALADYGYWIQRFLCDVRGWSIGSDYADMKTVYKDASTMLKSINTVKNAVSDRTITKSMGESDVEEITFSVNFETEVAIRVYFKMKEGYTGTPVFKIGDQTVTATKMSDGRFRVEIGGIYATQLDQSYTVTAKTASGTATISNLSPLSYVKAILNLGNTAKPMENYYSKYGVMSFYYYGEAAKAYAGAH